MKLFSSIIKNIIIPIREFIFPPLCFSCGEFLLDNERRICEKCWSSLKEVNQNDYTVKILKSRFEKTKLIDEFFTHCYFESGGVLQTLAHHLKYEEMTIFGFELGKKLAGQIPINILEKVDGLIPIPLHKIKERERGYNQSFFIAKGIVSEFKIPIYKDLIIRKKYTTSQTKLNLMERKQNVSDAFSINPKFTNFVKGKNFIIVDDIITTGATIEAVASVLKNFGVEKIYVASSAIAKLDKNENPPDISEGLVVAGAGLEPTTFGL